MIPLPRHSLSLDWITLLLFFGLLLVTFGKYYFKGAFVSFFILPFNNKYIGLTKKKGLVFNGFHVLMTAFQLINIPLFLYMARNVILGHTLTFYPTMFWVMLLVLLGFIVVKIGLYLANGYFFEQASIMKELIFQKLSYFNYGGILAFFANCYLAYIGIAPVVAVYGTFVLLLAVHFIGLGNILRNNQKLIRSNVSYFILYLCALEIAPLLILFGTLKG